MGIGLSDDICSQLLSSSIREMDLIHAGIKGRVPVGQAHWVSLLVTLLTEDHCKFLGVPNWEKHLSVDEKVSSCLGGNKVIIQFGE